MKHIDFIRSGKTRALIVLISVAAFLTLALQNPVSSQAAPPSAPPAAPKSPSDQNQIFLPMVVGISPAAPPAPAPSKKGVGMPYPDCNDALNAGVSWEYTWGTQPPNCAGIDNVPMIWGAGNVNATITGSSQWLMGFNEPDQPDQSNIPAATAAVAWHQIEQKYPERKLVAPAPSHLHLNWLVDFRNAYITQYGKPPRLDALAMHCYLATAAECIQLGQSYKSMAQAWGVKEVWVTEFAFLSCLVGSDEKAVSEGQTMMNWIRESTHVHTHGLVCLPHPGNGALGHGLQFSTARLGYARAVNLRENVRALPLGAAPAGRQSLGHITIRWRNNSSQEA